jgi:hypothetical protein
MPSLIPKSSPQQTISSTTLSDGVGPNIVNRQLREVFREAFDRLGGADFLVEFATASEGNARVFVSAMSKLLPATIVDASQNNRIKDIPWLTRERLSYKEQHGDVTDIFTVERSEAVIVDVKAKVSGS